MGDVALPPWAADAADCVAQLAAALESPRVSARLHHWIDLVFGCASRGAAAERADNVFHYLTYDDMCAGICVMFNPKHLAGWASSNINYLHCRALGSLYVICVYGGVAAHSRPWRCLRLVTSCVVKQ